jgi:hypothetical protein
VLHYSDYVVLFVQFFTSSCINLIYCLFNNDVSSTDYTAWNDRITNEAGTCRIRGRVVNHSTATLGVTVQWSLGKRAIGLRVFAYTRCTN